MKLDTILKTADDIRSRFEVEDPAFLCEQAGVILLYFPMGNCKASCKGFILKQQDRTAITVSSDLNRELRSIIIYHELAHYFLHVNTGIAENLQDFAVGSPASDMEYEADMLAAELSLNDEKVLDALHEEADFFSAAARLHTIPELLDFKLRLMRHKGYILPDTPIDATGGFLAQVSSFG